MELYSPTSIYFNNEPFISLVCIILNSYTTRKASLSVYIILTIHMYYIDLMSLSQCSAVRDLPIWAYGILGDIKVSLS